MQHQGVSQLDAQQLNRDLREGWLKAQAGCLCVGRGPQRLLQTVSNHWEWSYYACYCKTAMF